MRIVMCGLVALGLCVPGVGKADSWEPPGRETYVSANGEWRFTVDPRPIRSAGAYFEDKVAGTPNAGAPPGNTQVGAVGTMERRAGSGWTRAWRRSLRNEVSPVHAVATNTGAVATFDNWHSMGFGTSAVVVYDHAGKALASYALADFLPREYVKALPRSVSSLHWRGTPSVSADGRLLKVPVVVPEADPDAEDVDASGFVDVAFDMTTGRPLPMSGPAWERALQAVAIVRRQQIAHEGEERRWFTTPLAAPTTGGDREWSRYLVEAYFRLDPGWRDGYPVAHYLRDPRSPGYEQSLGWIVDALHERRIDPAVMMFGSAAQRNFADALIELAASLEAGSLGQCTIYLVLSDVPYGEVAEAMAGTGARLVQVDPATPIAQRPERLEKFNARVEDESGD